MPWHIEEEARENPSWLAAMMINLNGFELETPSIPTNFGLGSASCVVSFEPMSVLYFALGLIAVYAAIVTAMYVGQTWLLFPNRARSNSAGSASFVNAAFRGQDAGWRKPKGNPYPI